MNLSPEYTIELGHRSDLGGVPFQELRRELLQVELEPHRTRALLEAHNGRLREPVLRPQGVEDGGLLVEERVLAPPGGPWAFSLQSARHRWETTLEAERVPALAHFLRTMTHSGDAREIREHWPFTDIPWSEELLVPAAGAWHDWPETPGIYRLEHASLLIRSRYTGILLDPISLQRRMPHMGRLLERMPPGSVDAVALTHGSADHWHLPSLLANLARPLLPVVVPRVPAPNLLTPEDFEASLRACGQAVRAPAWGETFLIKDIQVDVLPFYGGQPVRDGPALREGLRSWGNCYRFTTEDFSCLVLADSGADPAGDMARVVGESSRKRGPVDVVLACQGEYFSPFSGGQGHDWAALPWSRLRECHQAFRQKRLPSVTAGPVGLADVCSAARARYFLPYANGFEGPGQPITDVGWGGGGLSEARRSEQLRQLLRRAGAMTRVLGWNPGDAACFNQGVLLPGRVRTSP